MSAVRRVLAGVIPVLLAVLDTASAGAQVITFRACRVPSVGALYIIGVPGVPAACLDASHVEFSWTEGGPPADASVTTSKLADGSVTSLKIADGAVAGVDLADGSVTNSKLGDNTVTSAKLVDGAVTASKIPDRSIPGSKLMQIIGMVKTTVGWGTDVPCGTSWQGGGYTVPGAAVGDAVVITNLHPDNMSFWAHQKAFVSAPNTVNPVLYIQGTGCPAPAKVGAVPVLIVVYRP